MSELFFAFFNFVELTIICYVAAISAIYMVLMLLGYFAMRANPGSLSEAEARGLSGSGLMPSVSVIAPAYNESVSIRASVRALLSLNYPDHEVIVVNDGSSDETLQILIDEFRLFRSSRVAATDLQTCPIRGIYESRDPIPLIVVDKENGGKADALNAGLNVSRRDLVAAIDADSILERDALLTATRPFLFDDTLTLATGGLVRVANGCTVEHGRVVEVDTPRALLPLFQVVEYLRTFLGGRVAFSFMNALLIVSGAFGVFDRRAVIEAGGFWTPTVGEDMELVVRLHAIARSRREPYRIVFLPEPVCWTEAPESLRGLYRQRTRWQRGTVETLSAHRELFFNPRAGAVGMFAVPYFTLFEMLGPTVELSGYLLTIVGLAWGIIPVPVALAFFIVSVLFGMVLSLGAIALEELTLRRYPTVGDLLKLTGAAFIESLGFRQLMSVWRTIALVQAARGQGGWGKMDRRGFGAPPA